MLDADIFDGLSALEILNLSNNSLSMLDADIFDPLSALEILFLHNNSLEMLDADIFDGLDALTEINLNNNALSMLDADIFDGLSALTTLNLANNDLMTLPDGIFSDLTNLVAVNVAGNPEDDSDPLTLTVVATESSPGSVAIEVAQAAPFAVAATLTIQGGTFSGNNTTTSVTLSTGMIRSIPVAYTIETDGISATISLTISSPTNTEIENGFALDPVTAEISGYSGFQLASGPGLTLQTGICNRTPAVQTALLAAINTPPPNPLVTCDAVTTAQLAAIASLNLGDGTPSDDTDDITALQAGDFAGLTGLGTLFLNGHLFTTLPTDIFSDLGNLTNLFMQFGALTTLEEGAFNGLDSLRTLNMSDNSFSTLVADRFSGLTELRTLNLDSNNLTELPAGLFSGLTNLTTVTVQNNPNLGGNLTLTVTPKETTSGMAAIEVVEGIPFTSVTATVTITNGTFDSNSMTTITGVEIVKGETQSAEFAYTADANQSTITLAVSNLVSDPGNILDSTNYNGFMLAGKRRRDDSSGNL